MADCTTARRYLHLVADSAREVTKLVSPMSSGPEINRLQCNYLSETLAQAMARSKMYIIKGESEEHGELILKTLCRLAQDVERFVSFCCNEHWRHSAVLLGDPSERVTQIASELLLSIQLLQIITSNSSGATEHQSILTPEVCQSMRELGEADVAVIKKYARLDKRNLKKRLVDEYRSSIRKRKRLHDFMTLCGYPPSSTVLSPGPIPSEGDADRKLLRLKSIGRGAFATVYKLKWMRETYAQKEFTRTHIGAFETEASILASLSHPNIIPIVGFCASSCSLLIELMDGDLHALMEERVMNLGEVENPNVPFDLTEAVDLMLQIAEGVRYLHKEAILHGNLRAANVLIKQVKPLRQFPGNDQKHFQAKVASFGLARDFKNKNMTYKTQTCRADSVRWMAPELLGRLDVQVSSQDDSQDVHKDFPLQADVYSFGMVCFEILTGCIPFSEVSLSDLPGKILEGLKPEIPKTCPPRLTVMIERCWSVSPSERPSFQEICKELTRFKCEVMIENKVDLPAQSSRDCSSSKLGRMKSDLEYDESRLNKLEEKMRSADIKMERDIADYLIERCKTKRGSSCYEADSADLKTQSRLGKGESGIIYEITLVGYSFARKDFPGTFEARIVEEESSKLIDLRHVNIVRTFCWALDRRSYSVVMELMSDDLHTLVQKRKEMKRKASTTSTNSLNSTVKVEESKNQKEPLKTFLERVKMMPHNQAIIPFDISEAIDIIFQVAKGMKYLHGQRVAHGDLKPKNILVEFHPTGLDRKVVKVCDFGLTKTKMLSSLSSTVQTQHVGTCRWKAPELIKAVKDEESYDLFKDRLLSRNQTGPFRKCLIKSKLAKADVYSFAMTCMEILTGEVPFSKSEFNNLDDFHKGLITGVRPNLPATFPRELQNLLQRCWDTHPACRPTFNEICDELEKFQQDVKRGTTSIAQDEIAEQHERMGTSHVCKGEVPHVDNSVPLYTLFLRPAHITVAKIKGRHIIGLFRQFSKQLAREFRMIEHDTHAKFIIIGKSIMNLA